MTELQRIRCTWNGWSGAPGVSTFYMVGTDYSTALTPLKNFWTALQAFIPQNIQVTVPSSGDVIEDSTGALVGAWATGTDQTVTMTGTGAYSAASGGQIRWTTDAIHRRRRLAGRTFIVPLVPSCYGLGGDIEPTHRTNINTAAGNLITACADRLSVWGRPLQGLGGTSAMISGSVVPGKVAVLRSRRD